MYAVKKGHVEVVKCLMKCTDLDLWIKNRVCLIFIFKFLPIYSNYKKA